MIRTRALLYKIDGKPKVFIDDGRPERLDGLHRQMVRFCPQNEGRIVYVEIREIVVPVQFAAEGGVEE